MGKISYKVFDNCSYPVFYKVDGEVDGKEVLDSPASIDVSGSKKLNIWAAESKAGPAVECCIKFPAKIEKDGTTYETGDFEISLTQNGNRFTLTGAGKSQTDNPPWLPVFLINILARLRLSQKDIMVLVNVTDHTPRKD